MPKISKTKQTHNLKQQKKSTKNLFNPQKLAIFALI
jgi:hypothetical protein